VCRVASFRQRVGDRTSLVPCRGVDKIRNRQNQLAHHLPESELLNTVLQLLAEQGYEGFAEGVRLLVNKAIREERASVLQAQPYERTETRLGPANGYQAQTAAITFQVSQVRRTAFYSSALEKVLRSERALKLALAEMYVLGVFTRKVSAIVEKLYGFAVGSTQVSQCSAPRSPRPFAASLTPRTIRPPTCVARKSSSPARIWLQTWRHGWKPTFPQACPSLPDPSPSTGACAPASPASFPKKPHYSHWFQPD
jgi:Transposase, Mutator family